MDVSSGMFADHVVVSAAIVVAAAVVVVARIVGSAGTGGVQMSSHHVVQGRGS